MLQLEHRGHRLPAHVLDGVLVAEPVGALNRVVHVETPVVAVAHVSERGRHAALRRHGVAARRKHLCDAGRFQSRCGHSERRAQSCPARTDDHDVIAVLDDLVSLCHSDVSGAGACILFSDRHFVRRQHAGFRRSQSRPIPGTSRDRRCPGRPWVKAWLTIPSRGRELRLNGR